MWIIQDNYGDDPAPRRYFLREKPEVAAKEEDDQPDLDWRSFSVILMRALMPFAEAKAAVLAAFRDVGVCRSPP
jgi:hypothetical protein